MVYGNHVCMNIVPFVLYSLPSEKTEQTEELPSVVSTTQSEHNLFLQTLGIIAKQRLVGNQPVPVTGPLVLTGSTPLAAQTITSLQQLGINVQQTESFGTVPEISSVQTSTNSR